MHNLEARLSQAMTQARSNLRPASIGIKSQNDDTHMTGEPTGLCSGSRQGNDPSLAPA
jgi:hypothetical protein